VLQAEMVMTFEPCLSNDAYPRHAEKLRSSDAHVSRRLAAGKSKRAPRKVAGQRTILPVMD
jgi:hypothetical protein